MNNFDIKIVRISQKTSYIGMNVGGPLCAYRFTCLFCEEQFLKDYKLKLHLLLTHKNEPAELMKRAKEELIKVL